MSIGVPSLTFAILVTLARVVSGRVESSEAIAVPLMILKLFQKIHEFLIENS